MCFSSDRRGIILTTRFEEVAGLRAVLRATFFFAFGMVDFPDF
jgi:hypothetical protein